MRFSLNQATVLNAVRGGGLLSVVNSVLAPGYGVYYASGASVGTKPFSPTSFVVIEVGAKRRSPRRRSSEVVTPHSTRCSGRQNYTLRLPWKAGQGFQAGFRT